MGCSLHAFWVQREALGRVVASGKGRGRPEMLKWQEGSFLHGKDPSLLPLPQPQDCPRGGPQCCPILAPWRYAGPSWPQEPPLQALDEALALIPEASEAGGQGGQLKGKAPS